jgi:GntR family transcriptional regulator/GntR family frlABCD operon transcriptional regulator
MTELENLPHYRRLYETLRKHITEGVYQEGDLLPSENELCRAYNLTRPTVRKALDNLLRDGFIKKQQGKGSIVHKLPKGIGILSIGGTTDALGDQNLNTTIVVKPIVQNWPENFPFELSVPEKESGCIYFERLRYLNTVPVFFDITYIPNINIPRFTSRQFENTSLFDTLRKYYQIEIIGGEQRLSSIKAGKTLSEHFGVSEEHPILHLERKLDTNRINFNIYSSVYCNTEEYSLYGTF